MADTVTLPGTGAVVATDDISSVHYQRVKRSVGADGAATDFLDKSSRSDTYTTTANGTTVDVSAQAMSTFAIQAVGTGATPTSWTFVLEGSLNGSNWTTLATHTNSQHSNGDTVWVTAPKPVLYFRSRCSAISLGAATNIVVTILGVPYAGGGGASSSSTAVSTSHLVTAATTNATSIKASAGTLRGVSALNVAGYPIYIKFHNTAGSPTAGSGVVYVVGVQAGTRVDHVIPGGGRSFGTGIAMTVVTGIADSDNSAVALNDAVLDVSYE